jgi:hypothetical protein
MFLSFHNQESVSFEYEFNHHFDISIKIKPNTVQAGYARKSIRLAVKYYNMCPYY